jgi:hypothetical protein
MIAILNVSTNKENEMNEFQKFCQEIQWVVIAAAKGDDIQYLDQDGQWKDKPPHGFTPKRTYRVKPKTINIGSIEVPSPAIDKCEIYKRYYVPNMLVDRKYSICVWSNKKRDFDFLRNGMVHATKEGAVKHADALISLTYK